MSLFPEGLLTITAPIWRELYMILLGCSVGTILFTALGISVAAICAHGAFHVPDDLFTEEAEVCPNPDPVVFCDLVPGLLLI
jgi:hypothetical protein